VVHIPTPWGTNLLDGWSVALLGTWP